MTMVGRLNGGSNVRIEQPLIMFMNKNCGDLIHGVMDNLAIVACWTGLKIWMDSINMLKCISGPRVKSSFPTIVLRTCGQCISITAWVKLWMNTWMLQLKISALLYDSFLSFQPILLVLGIYLLNIKSKMLGGVDWTSNNCQSISVPLAVNQQTLVNSSSHGLV